MTNPPDDPDEDVLVTPGEAAVWALAVVLASLICAALIVIAALQVTDYLSFI